MKKRYIPFNIPIQHHMKVLDNMIRKRNMRDTDYKGGNKTAFIYRGHDYVESLKKLTKKTSWK